MKMFMALFTMILGVGTTVAVQSSSITTSVIVPLVGSGILKLKQAYPFTLGANVGTTCTALLASLATVSVVSGGGVSTVGITAAFAHLLFNLCGIAVFYPLRNIPISLAMGMARIVSERRWLAIVFVLGVFYLLPFLMIFLTQ